MVRKSGYRFSEKTMIEQERIIFQEPAFIGTAELAA
jgi:hypothetical protein